MATTNQGRTSPRRITGQSSTQRAGIWTPPALNAVERKPSEGITTVLTPLDSGYLT
jgi:hypothetical protein